MSDRDLSAGMLAAIAANTVRPAILYEGVFDNGGVDTSVYLWTGVGTLTWDSKSWLGGGNLLNISPIEETGEVRAVGFQVSLSGMSQTMTSLFQQSLRSGRRGKLWLALFKLDPYLNLPGTSGSYASAPDSSIGSTDFELIIRARLNDWTPASVACPAAKWVNNLQSAFILEVIGTGALKFTWTPDGTAASLQDEISTASTGFSDGTTHWLRVTLDGNDGSGNHVVNFYTCPSEDGTTWVQLGTSITVAGLTNIFNGNDPISLGAFGSGGTNETFAGRIYYAEFRNAIGGAAVRKFDPSQYAPSSTGETYTINGSAHIISEEVVISDPYPLRRGRLDVGITEDDGDTCILTAKYEDRLRDLERPREHRWTKEDQELLVPGDTGFDNVAALQDAVFTW